MHPTWDGSGMHISQEIGSTECYGGPMRVMHATARGGLEREAHALKLGLSSPPLSFALEKLVANFDQPETWFERA